MRIILCIMFLVLLLLYIKNKREMFSNNNSNSSGEIVVGDVSYEDFLIDEMKINEFLYEKGITPKLMNYSIGKDGLGVTEEVTTLSLDAESVKSTIPEAIKTMGDKEIVNLQAIVPILVQVAQNNTKELIDIKIKFEKLRAEFIETKK
jgi:hypothetical protein